MVLFEQLALLALLQIGIARAASFLPENFTFWLWQKSLVVDRWLYIDGGEIWARWGGSNNSASAVWNQQTMAVDLTTSWTTSSVSAVVTNKSLDAPFGRRPDLWYDPTVDMVYSITGDLYTVNGPSYNYDALPSLWGFKPEANGSVNWQAQPWATNGQSAALMSNVAGVLTATSSTGHYNLGGYINFLIDQNNTYYTSSLAMEEMFSYNFGNQSWYNQTLPGQHYLYGEAQYVPIFGMEGVIIFLGGKWPSDRSVSTKSSLEGLDTILVYDIHTNRFFKQPASNAPPSRYSFCSVAAGASNNASYEIFIYGGSQGIDVDSTLDDALRSVYILTLPAFHWIQAPGLSPIWRSDHTCSVIGKRQMLSIGGVQDDNINGWSSITDPWTNGMGIFDMTTLNWTYSYNATAAAYEPASLVTDFYSNHSRYPAVWIDPLLQSIFTVNPTSNTSSTNSSSGSNMYTVQTSNSNSNTGVIIGAVVGSIAALAIVGGIAYWLWGRPKIGDQTLPPLDSIVTPMEMDTATVVKELSTSANCHELQLNDLSGYRTLGAGTAARNRADPQELPADWHYHRR